MKPSAVRVASRIFGLVSILVVPPSALSAAESPPPASCEGGGCEPCRATDAPSRAGFLAPEKAEHYARLAALSGAPRAGGSGLDRKPFPLSSMSASYLKTLDLAPAYLDVPLESFELLEMPVNSSQQTRSELDFLLELQAKRTPAQVAESKRMAGVYYRVSVRPEDADWPAMRRNLFQMGRQLGAWFGPEELPVTADFMARVWSDATYYLWAAKFRFDRNRPYALEPRLQNLETPNFPAYPSAHSGNSYVAAYVLAELIPESRALFEHNAADMAYSREILGVHFPSDSVAGRGLARQIVDRMLQVPKFRDDLEAARREIRAVRSQQAETTEAPAGSAAIRAEPDSGAGGGGCC